MPRGLSRPRSTIQGKRKRLTSKSQSRSRSRSATSARGNEYGAPQDNFIELPEETIAYEEVLQKYKLAASIVNRVLKTICEEAVVGASVYSLCKKGDVLITEQASSHYKKPDEDGDMIDRGIAFPTCVNVNTIVCHFHPMLQSEDIVLAPGDVVRVELGAHIDGYISSAAHTLIVGLDPNTPLGVEAQIKADVLAATYIAASAALRLMKPGGCNHEVTEMFRSVCHSYGVQSARGVLSHRVRRWDEQGQQIILGHQSIEDSMFQETVIFRPNQIWSLDVVFMNGGDNTLRLKSNTASDHHLFKRSEVLENQRLASARYVLTTLRQQGNVSVLPFTMETFAKESRARLGTAMLVKRQLLDPIPILHCKPFQCVARYKWTVLITGKEVLRVAGLPPCVPITTERVVRDVATLLTSSLKVRADGPPEAAGAKRRRRPPLQLTDAPDAPTPVPEETGARKKRGRTPGREER